MAEVEDILGDLRTQLIGKLARVVLVGSRGKTRGPIIVKSVERYRTSRDLTFYITDGKDVWYFGANGWYVETVDGGRIYG